MNHVSVSPTDGNLPTQGQRKTLTRVGIEYSNSLAKVQVCAMFRAGDTRRNVLLKFIWLCMEWPCLCPSVIEFCYKKLVVVF